MKIRKLMPCYPEKPKTDSWKRPQLTVKRKIHTISRFLTRKMKQRKIQLLMSLLKTVKQLLLSLIWIIDLETLVLFSKTHQQTILTMNQSPRKLSQPSLNLNYWNQKKTKDLTEFLTATAPWTTSSQTKFESLKTNLRSQRCLSEPKMIKQKMVTYWFKSLTRTVPLRKMSTW